MRMRMMMMTTTTTDAYDLGSRVDCKWTRLFFGKCKGLIRTDKGSNKGSW